MTNTPPVGSDAERALLPCPFCGWQPPMDDLRDVLYPNGIFRRYDAANHIHHYVSFRDRRDGDERCWEMNCTQNMGGCGAEISGDTRDEAITRWNTRSLPALPEPGMRVVPVEPTTEMISAMACSSAEDAEGPFPALLDLIDFSGENKTHTVLKAAYAAMLNAAPSRLAVGDGREPLSELKKKYEELLYAVGNKYPGESRHQTALRYIQQAEIGDNRPAQTAHGIKPPSGGKGVES